MKISVGTGLDRKLIIQMNNSGAISSSYQGKDGKSLSEVKNFGELSASIAALDGGKDFLSSRLSDVQSKLHSGSEKDVIYNLVLKASSSSTGSEKGHPTGYLQKDYSRTSFRVFRK